MNGTKLKNIRNLDKKWLEEFYDLLWESLGLALMCVLFWLMYVCIVW